MTEPLQRPPRKSPQERIGQTSVPPFRRSRQALVFTTAAAEGLFKLQRCEACGYVSYPAREICPKCWSMDLRWEAMPEGGQLISETTLRSSSNAYFSERLPWRIGTVQLDVGPTVLAHVHGDVAELARVKMIARTDKSGQGVLFALPDQETPNMADDQQLRTLTCDPKSRRVLITDGRTELGQAMAQALAKAGALGIFVGVAGNSQPFSGSAALSTVPGVEWLPLDLTNTRSVNELAAKIGDKVDILINTAEFVHPGGGMDRQEVETARDEMEINYFGLLRLIQAFGPPMKSRGTDSETGACAWVNLLSVYALSNRPDFGTTSASQAAAYSLSQCLRAELAGSGIKLVTVLSGPLEGGRWQSVPPPKVAPRRLAGAVVHALQQGIEHVTLGPVAEDLVKRYREDPMVLERELALAERNAS